MGDVLSFVLFADASKSTASAWAFGGEIGLLLTSIAVLAGLYGEHRWEKWMQPPPRIKLLHRAAVMAVMLGVFGELISDAVIFLSSHRLQVVQETQVEELRSRNLALEKQIEPRRLNDTAKALISSSLVPFLGKRVIVASYAFDTDGIILAEQISQAILKALLPVSSEIGAHIPSHAPIIEGVKITGGNEGLVASLKRAIQTAGLQLDPGTGPVGQELLEFNEPPDAEAKVFVGTKPSAP